MDTIKITSPAFKHNEMIPVRYTCDGEDISPPVQWEGIPEGTESLVLIADDPDAPSGTWVHWVCYDIPPDSDSLPENIKNTDKLENGGTQGTTDFGKIGYGGPCPPGGTHRYFFKLYALDKRLELAPGKTKKEVLEKMKGHVTASGELAGTYSRK